MPQSHTHILSSKGYDHDKNNFTYAIYSARSAADTKFKSSSLGSKECLLFNSIERDFGARGSSRLDTSLPPFMAHQMPYTLALMEATLALLLIHSQFAAMSSARANLTAAVQLSSSASMVRKVIRVCSDRNTGMEGRPKENNA